MENELLISGIQHFSFCRRQWALIHIEGEWSDNYFTVDGHILHENADDPFFTEKRGNVIISRALDVKSEEFAIVGKCDVVEFHSSEDGVKLAGREGLWLPTPVEYKRGMSKDIDADRLQLCAQAICLEEMLCCKKIERGFLYYAATRRREEVSLNSALREETVSCLKEMRELYERKYTPKVKTSVKCRSCSMKDICLPKLQKYKSAREYTDTIWNDGGEV